MATYERVEQELAKAEVQLEEAKAAVTAFEEGEAQGKLLGKLRLWLADVEEGTAAQRAEWKEMVVDLAAEKKRLEGMKEYWAKQVGEWGAKLRELTQPGNDFVTRAL